MLFGLYSRLSGKPFYDLLYPLYVRYRASDRRKSAIATIDGITYELDLTQHIDSSIYHKGSFEPETIALMARLVKPGMTVLDVGANVGSHTFRLAKLVGPTGQVIAFEPMRWAYGKLCRNAQLNSFSNVTLEKIAIGNENGTLRAAFRTRWSIDGSSDEPEQENVVIMRLDDYLTSRGVKPVDFIKLDVDGYEYKVLQGAVDTLRSSAPLIVMEFATWTLERVGDEASEMLDYLELLGYEFLVGSDFNQLIQKEMLLDSTSADTTVNVLCRGGEPNA